MRQWGYRYADTPDGYVPCSEEHARTKAASDLAVVVIYRDNTDSQWTEEPREVSDLVRAAEQAMPIEIRNRRDARLVATAVLRELAAATAGYPELITTDELIDLADQIEQENHRGQ